MARLPLTINLLATILAHVPEGFMEWTKIQKQCETAGLVLGEVCAAAADQGIGYEAGAFYDTARVSGAEVQARRAWCRPQMPAIHGNGKVAGPTIRERQATRAEQVAALTDPVAVAILQRLAQSADGYLWRDSLRDITAQWGILHDLQRANLVGLNSDFVFDPLRLLVTNGVADNLRERKRMAEVQRSAERALAAQPFDCLAAAEWEHQFTADQRAYLLQGGQVVPFTIRARFPPQECHWFAHVEADLDAAKAFAEAQVRATDNGWKPLLARCGETLRDGAKPGKTTRMQVLARSYLTGPAARRIGLPERALLTAIRQGKVSTFIDPEKKTRIPAAEVERIASDGEAQETITAFIIVKPRDLAVVCGRHPTTLRRRLLKLGLSTTEPTWGKVRGLWELPATYAIYRQLLDEKWEAIKVARYTELTAQQRILEEKHARDQAERAALRERLIAAFPDWRHAGRAHQHVILSTGPANSGKTHVALERLVALGSGWYLAPLRLLAYEIYDRLNRQGIACNLVTGEEVLPVDGARITAATIEMFNPSAPAACVVIDEAQMLADPDRGWAWTRALMEARAEEIHVLGSPTVLPIVERLLQGVDQAYLHQPRERLTPLTVAPAPWKFAELPARTIVVAFSRASVLSLKTDLEKRDRSVSIVYGALPPEVRRRQADRFAAGETEICVATDAVGMGLNLPADHVCFYETSKYDGRLVRPLTSAEIHQIGGRAGRFGFAAAGLIGAVNQHDLTFVRQRFEQTPAPLAQAYVAPSLADLALIPGRLAARLRQWRELESIPPTMHTTIAVADLEDRIDLALMLHPNEEEELGLAAAVKLTNAPVRRDSRLYWRHCATAILKNRPMPLPSDPPQNLEHSLDLARAETAIACADLYLWLARAPEFLRHGLAYDDVRATRYALSERIDAALVRRLDLRKRCPECGRVLPKHHPHRLCDSCYYEQRYARMGHFADDDPTCS